MAKEAQRQKERYDSKLNVNKYQPGDLVWYLHERRQEGECPKLQFPYLGPALVLEKMGELNYVIQLQKNATPQNIHHDKLKSYTGTSKLSWSRSALAKYAKK